MNPAEIIPNGIYGRRVRGRVQACHITHKGRFGVTVRPFYSSCNTWGIPERAAFADLFPLPAGNPLLREAIAARPRLAELVPA